MTQQRICRKTRLIATGNKISTALTVKGEKFTYLLRYDGLSVTTIIEREFWEALMMIADRELVDVDTLCTMALVKKNKDISFGTALRVFALQYFIKSF